MQNLLEKLEGKLITVYENKHSSKKLIDELKKLGYYKWNTMKYSDSIIQKPERVRSTMAVNARIESYWMEWSDFQSNQSGEVNAPKPNW